MSASWRRTGRSATLVADAARRCEAGGAEMVGLCTNLMHKYFPTMEAALSVPAVHIADAVVFACTEIGLLVGPDEAPLPSIDSATAHADLLVDLALKRDQVG